MKQIVIENEHDRQKVIKRLQEFDLTKRKCLFTIENYVEGGTEEQRKGFHWWLRKLAQLWYEAGHPKYGPETWKILFRKLFLGYEDITMPNGKIEKRLRRTRDLKKREYSEFMEQIDYYCATELEIVLPRLGLEGEQYEKA